MSLNLRPTVTVERFINGGWEDMSYTVASAIEIDRGMASANYEDRLAKVGTFSFKIDHDYLHGTDFPRHMPIRIRVNAGGASVKEWICYVDRIDPGIGNVPYGERGAFTGIHCVDWFGLAYTHLLRNVVVQDDMRMDAAVTALLADMPIQPEGVQAISGDNVFPIVFDAINMGKTTMYSELQHLVMSELGYIYLKSYGKLWLEPFSYRVPPPSSLSTVPYTSPVTGAGAILTSPAGNGYLLREGGGRLLLSEGESGEYSGEIERTMDAEVVHGGNVLNDVSFVVQPRQVDMSEGAYYQLYTYNLYDENPTIPLANGTTVTLRGKYPEDGAGTGKTADAAMDVQEPNDSIGPSLYVIEPSDAGCTFNFVGGADSWKWAVTNNGDENKEVTYIELVGRPIYRQQPLEYLVEDLDSQSLYGKNSLRIEQVYQQSLARAILETERIMLEEKNPRTIVKTATANANYNEATMAAFIYTDIGDYRRVTTGGIASYYFVQGMKERIQQNGIIDYTMVLREVLSETPFLLRFSGVTGSKNIVEFTSPYVDNLTTKTIALWVYMRGSVSDASMVNKLNGSAGWAFHMINGIDTMQFLQRFSGGAGVWRMPNGCLTGLTNGWHHIAVTFDKSSTANNPVMYLDGVSQTVTETFTPSGTAGDDTGLLLRLGNTNYPGEETPSAFAGSMKDIRVYDRILSGAEVLELASNENNFSNIPSGLVFSTPWALSTQVGSYHNQPITPDMPISDHANRRIGHASYDTGVTGGALKGGLIGFATP